MPAVLLSPFAFLGSLLLFLLGLAIYALSGKTPRLCFHAMRRTYGPTNGLPNRIALRVARYLRPQAPVGPVTGFLGEFTPAEIGEIVRRIESEGYVVFDRVLPREICDQLQEFARTTPCLPMGAETPVLYSEATSNALRYDFAEQDILANVAACMVSLDGTLAAIAGAYFGCLPIYDFSAMWWTTRFGKRELSKAAQEFHFDMDRMNFLKFFIYLTDVTEQSGPHVFVAGSHRYKPRPLRDPVRFDDGDVAASYPVAAVRSICGPRGLVFAADTSGIHKGMPVISGHRLVYQVEFATGMFGQNYPRPKVHAESIRAAGLAPIDKRIYGNIDVLN
jgi:hypothetical protein